MNQENKNDDTASDPLDVDGDEALEKLAEGDLASVRRRMVGTYIRLIDKASDDDLTVHMGKEWENIWSDLRRMAARDIATEIYEQQTFDPPPTHRTLADELKIKDERRTPFITDTDRDEREGTLLWDGQTLVIVARYKVGKTTLILNLTRSLVDGVPFLDHFKIGVSDTRVGVWNYELPPWQWREWASEHGIKHKSRVSLLHLRGYQIDLMRDHDAEWAVEWLREHKVTVWVLDTWLAALNGREENDNTGAADFYRAVQRIARRAGVRVVVWVTQQGTGDGNQTRGPARARGATALMDNADAIWTYTSHNDERILNATGRDVDYPEFSVAYDWRTRTLSYGEEKSANKAAQRSAIDAYKPQIIEYLTNLPTEVEDGKRNTTGVTRAMGDASNTGVVGKALRELDDEQAIHHIHGARRSLVWWIGKGSVERPCQLGDCGKGRAERVTPSKARRKKGGRR